MSLLTVEGHYTEGKVNLDEIPAGVTASRVLVTFLPEKGEPSARSERRAAEQRLFVLMQEKTALGGGPYYKERGEIYEP